MAAVIAVTLSLLSALPDQAMARGCKGAGKATSSLKTSQARKAVQCLVNRERKGMRNLRSRRQLVQAARSHNRYMRNHNCFSHHCAGESDLSKRITKTGYMRGARSYGFGEVIASNRSNASPRDIVRQFKNSSVHRAQLLNRSYEHFGVSIGVWGGKTLCTIVLGRRD